MASTITVPHGDNKADSLTAALDKLAGTVIQVVDGGNRWVVIFEPKPRRAPAKKETR